jgi:acetyl esterase/lipase
MHDVTVEDIAYLKIGEATMLARIYRPKEGGPYPGVVEVHGGAWTGNDRLTNADIDHPLAASGVVVMAIDFRMPPAAQYPGPVADINFAIRWLRANAERMNVDPAKIGLLGTSSGGHQGLLATMRPTDDRYLAHEDAGADDASIAFIAICWAVADPLARYQMVTKKGIERLVDAHHAYWPDKSAMDEGSPQRILDRGEDVSLPPLLSIQGKDDDNLTPDMAANFADAYRAAGGDVQLEIFEGAPHAFIAKNPESQDSKRAISLIIDFMRAQTGS